MSEFNQNKHPQPGYNPYGNRAPHYGYGAPADNRSFEARQAEEDALRAQELNHLRANFSPVVEDTFRRHHEYVQTDPQNPDHHTLTLYLPRRDVQKNGSIEMTVDRKVVGGIEVIDLSYEGYRTWNNYSRCEIDSDGTPQVTKMRPNEAGQLVPADDERPHDMQLDWARTWYNNLSTATPEDPAPMGRLRKFGNRVMDLLNGSDPTNVKK